MSWHFSKEFIFTTLANHDIVFAYFKSIGVTHEKDEILQKLPSGIYTEKEGTNILFKVLCKRNERENEKGPKDRAKEWVEIFNSIEQRWICNVLWCIASILLRQENDSKTCNANGITYWAQDKINRGCTPQEWEQARQRYLQFGVNDSVSSFKDAWEKLFKKKEKKEWAICVSLPCLPALVEEYLGESSLDGERFALSNTNHMPQLYSQSDKMMDFCTHSQYGMMCVPLTENHGEELLTWFLGGFRAKTSALPARERESKESEADCGMKCGVSFARYDRNASSWKTAQRSLIVDLEQFSATWPRWGMMLNGECSRLRQSVRHIKEREFSYWPTPIASDKIRLTLKLKSLAKRAKVHGANWNLAEHVAAEFDGYLTPQFVEWLMNWPQGWTGLQDAETVKFQEWLSLHGKY